MNNHHNIQHDTLATANPRPTPPGEQAAADDSDLLTWEEVDEWALDPLPEEDEAPAGNDGGLRTHRTADR